MGKAILVGALDTKGKEFGYVRNQLHRCGIETIAIDVGVLGTPEFQPDISSDEVARAGGSSLAQLQTANDRGEAIAVMAKGIEQVVKGVLADGQIGGLFGMGGTAGTTLGAAAAKALPIGIPKLLISTVASGDTRPYVGVKDVTMMYSVVDIAGLNPLSTRILHNGANALAGMISQYEFESESVAGEKPMVGMTMFGVTTPCVTRIRDRLEREGFEVLVFHATGAGGMAMEQLIGDGYVKGVVDVTTTELADEWVGGIFSAGANRLEAAGLAGIPQVVSVGAMDMVNFGPPDTVPHRFADRRFYQHNPNTTLMRTTKEENRQLGMLLAAKLNQSRSPTVVVFPRGGVSLLDMAGKAFDGPEERHALFEAIRSGLNENIQLVTTDKDINDPSVADLIAEHFVRIFRQ
ncbi:Tm-1-like ATP-binding domain-containing protein [Cohnella suwonensis]|uniref:Tm-1-like ATP-binding domain-containing protein n=1 Tax=Cohnella suwonensis TaxID=696072 RepID=A0ABW0LQV0_9BACL